MLTIKYPARIFRDLSRVYDCQPQHFLITRLLNSMGTCELVFSWFSGCTKIIGNSTSCYEHWSEKLNISYILWEFVSSTIGGQLFILTAFVIVKIFIDIQWSNDGSISHYFYLNLCFISRHYICRFTINKIVFVI